MRRLFKPSHAYLCAAFRSPKALVPISLLHNAGYIANRVEELQSSKSISQSSAKRSEPSDFVVPSKGTKESRVRIQHPWSEWVNLMECLLNKGYFVADGSPFEEGELACKESNYIRTACLKFARDRYSLIRYLSRKEIKVIAECGCPSLDRKVVNSGKRLRAYVQIDEENVCSSCNLRGNCDRAYVPSRKDEGGRTVDVMRILLTYGLNPITHTVENRSCENEIVKEAVRRLLKEMVKFSTLSEKCESSSEEKDHKELPMKQGDWHCPRCNFLNFARNAKCLRCDIYSQKTQELSEDQNFLPMKKGDWICDECNFLNFAKNTRCFQCKEKPSKRQLHPGEWECESCNFINFRRNMVCLNCDHRRPKASNASDMSARPQRQSGGHRNHNRWGFVDSGIEVISSKSVRQGSKNQKRGSILWRFAEEESNDEISSISRNEDSRFLDFPIEGGKSALSQNPKNREKWKLEMLERRQNAAITREINDPIQSSHKQRGLKLPESMDDKEMADWFGH
ncbi:LOW QUALITY PROTEIN: zinc finger protein VAR3, chloroplastic-like [Carica papaya]|uniref:LOW QUALITY PROTEIN: zinc finger protein VAR3, chloroplastic-like n=1 Tax=Carica papaya TaxID=3649 RepID=UPI000B8CF5F3|nr:LOW QUALITY PROTEIN: zinc finger protein VAR3, chloroplastic-like [Carica papaya]